MHDTSVLHDTSVTSVERAGVATLFGSASWLVVTVLTVASAAAEVRFDVPQWVEARPVARPSDPLGDRLVMIELNLSIIVDSMAAPRIDQLLVEITPRGSSARVADYAPRTELASHFASGIEVMQTDEAMRNVGVGLDAGTTPLAGASLNASRGDKNIASMKYNRVAPKHLVAASGTTHRGRGVYFKFRSTDQQIIEGDRLLRVVLRVPGDWRGELIDVLVIGDSAPPPALLQLPGINRGPRRVGQSRFLVAAFRCDDPQACQLARQMVAAESQMRDQLLAVGQPRSGEFGSAAAMVDYVARRIDWSTPSPGELARIAAEALHHALDGTLDAQGDREFARLPADARAACLQYHKARSAFVAAVR